MRAQPVRDSSVVVLPDSSNFVVASLVVVQPASSPMSSLGHVALRMQCPAYGLDFLWSQNTMDSPTLWMRQLYGNNPVAGVWQPTDSMLNVYRNEQRGTRQYTLNLTHHEKQRLWMLLDEVSEMGVNGRLRVDNHHCASAVIQQLKAATIQRQLDTGDEQRQIGQYGQWAARHSPWIQFALVLMAGNQHDRMLSRDCMVCPEDIVDYLKKARLTDDNGKTQPILTGEEKQLVPQAPPIAPLPLTPTTLLTIIAIAALCVTLARQLGKKEHMAQVFDKVLFTAYCLWSIVFIDFVIIGNQLIGATWNWYLIPFNPIPLIVWSICRNKQQPWQRIWAIYSITLALFLAITPISTQIQFPQQIITVTLLIRTVDRYLKARKAKSVHNNH